MDKHYDEPFVRVGYAFVPIQEFENLYSPEEALANGTAFAELNLPISVYGPKNS